MSKLMLKIVQTSSKSQDQFGQVKKQPIQSFSDPFLSRVLLLYYIIYSLEYYYSVSSSTAVCQNDAPMAQYFCIKKQLFCLLSEILLWQIKLLLPGNRDFNHGRFQYKRLRNSIGPKLKQTFILPCIDRTPSFCY